MKIAASATPAAEHPADPRPAGTHALMRFCTYMGVDTVSKLLLKDAA
jgi:hypothetical protein